MKLSNAYPTKPLPSPGAHLITPRRGYTHHGIYVGAGKVVHYAGLSRSLQAGPVEEVSLAEFAGEYGWTENESIATFGQRSIVGRARSRIGENRYSVVTNNCEHFCQWARSGQAHSAQVELWRDRIHRLLPMHRVARSFARTLTRARAGWPVALPAFVRAR